jgi:hypothetical protein
MTRDELTDAPNRTADGRYRLENEFRILIARA